MKRINSIEDFVIDQFEYLKWNMELSKQIRSTDLSRGYNAAILSIIAVGYPVTYNNGTLILSGERIGIDTSFMTTLSAYEDCKLQQLSEIVNGTATFFFKTAAEEEMENRICLEKEEAKEETTKESKNEEPVQVEETVTEETGKIEEKVSLEESPSTVEENEIVDKEKNEESELIIIEKKEKEIPKTAFGILEEPEAFKETSDYKYLNTMWFNKHHITCRYKDNKKGMGLNEFDVVVYPLEQPRAQAPQLPVQIMVCVLSQYNDRYKIFFPKNESKSASIELDEFTFLVTGRFSKGKFTSKVSLDPKCEYVITEDDDEVINQNGKYFPNNFGKVVEIGEDTVEFFPLYIDNKEQSGETSCVYRHIAPNTEPEYGLSNGQTIIATTVNQNRELVSYWNGYDEDKKFYVSMC